MSQEELAARAGYSSRSTIAKIEKGERNLNSDKIKAIAAALGVSVSYLFDGDENDTAPPQKAPSYSDSGLKFALFGGGGEITDAQLEEVKRFAKFVKERDKDE